MSLIPALLQAIVRIDGEALVMHAGDKPYVVSPTEQVDLASRGLTLEAVNGMVAQLLPAEIARALDEFGAVQHELAPMAEFPGEHFTVVAARGGDDVWVEIRRRRIPDEDRVPDEFFAPASQETAEAVASVQAPVVHAAAEQASVEYDADELPADVLGFDTPVDETSSSIPSHLAEARGFTAETSDDDLQLPDEAHLWPGRGASVVNIREGANFSAQDDNDEFEIDLDSDEGPGPAQPIPMRPAAQAQPAPLSLVGSPLSDAGGESDRPPVVPPVAASIGAPSKVDTLAPWAELSLDPASSQPAPLEPPNVALIAAIPDVELIRGLDDVPTAVSEASPGEAVAELEATGSWAEMSLEASPATMPAVPEAEPAAAWFEMSLDARPAASAEGAAGEEAESIEAHSEGPSVAAWLGGLMEASHPAETESARGEAERAAVEQAEAEAARLAAVEDAQREAERIAAEERAREAAQAAAEEQAAREAAEAAERTRREAERLVAEEAAREAARLAAAEEAAQEAARIAAAEEAEREAARIAAIAQAEREAARAAAEEEARREAERAAAEERAREAARAAAAEEAEREAARAKAAEDARREAERLAAEDAAREAARLAAEQQAAQEAARLAAAEEAAHEAARIAAAHEAEREAARIAAVAEAEREAARRAAAEEAQREAERAAAEERAREAARAAAAAEAEREAARAKAAEDARREAERLAAEEATREAARAAAEEAAIEAARVAAVARAEHEAALIAAAEEERARDAARAAAAEEAEREAARARAAEQAQREAERQAAEEKAREAARIAAEEAAIEAARAAAAEKVQREAAVMAAAEASAREAARLEAEQEKRREVERVAAMEAAINAARTAAAEDARREVERLSAGAAAIELARIAAAEEAARGAARLAAVEEAAREAARQAAAQEAAREAARVAAAEKAAQEAARLAAEAARREASQIAAEEVALAAVRAAAAEQAEREAARMAAFEEAAREAERRALADEARREAERVAAATAALEAALVTATEDARREAERLVAEVTAREAARIAAVEEAERLAVRMAVAEEAHREAERAKAEEAALEASRIAAAAEAEREAARIAVVEEAVREAARAAVAAAARHEAERTAAEEIAREAARVAAEEQARHDAERVAADEARREAARVASSGPIVELELVNPRTEAGSTPFDRWPLAAAVPPAGGMEPVTFAFDASDETPAIASIPGSVRASESVTAAADMTLEAPAASVAASEVPFSAVSATPPEIVHQPASMAASVEQLGEPAHAEMRAESSAASESVHEVTAASQVRPVPPQPAVVLNISRNPIRSETPAPAVEDPMLSGLERLLRVSSARGASTLYLSSGSRPSVRVDGELQMLDGEPVHAARDVESLLLTLMPARSHEALRTGAATEWISQLEGVGRVRCMSFRDQRGPGGVFRLMPTRSVSADEVGLPKQMQSLAVEPEGLVLIAGTRSSGKRTTMAAFVDLMNRTRRDHIITIEREITIQHERGNSFISQREVRGNDEDLLAAMRAALREDPDVLVVEELRTGALMNLALEGAAAGRLVVGGFTAHTATGAIDRIIDLYPPEQQRQVQMSLAHAMRGVIAQVLLRKIGGGRLPAREVLLNTPAVSSAIAEGKTSQLPMALEGGRGHGMMPLNDALVGLVRNGSVEVRDAWRHSPDRPGFLGALNRQGIDTSFVEHLANG
jgi:pilus retraction protein PilT